MENIVRRAGLSVNSKFSKVGRISLPSLSVPQSPLSTESACHAGDACLIPESGRSAGEGTGYPLQYYWASLVAQLVKNLPTMRKT